jgi:hypothetical protein
MKPVLEMLGLLSIEIDSRGKTIFLFTESKFHELFKEYRICPYDDEHVQHVVKLEDGTIAYCLESIS